MWQEVFQDLRIKERKDWEARSMLVGKGWQPHLSAEGAETWTHPVKGGLFPGVLPAPS